MPAFWISAGSLALSGWQAYEGYKAAGQSEEVAMANAQMLRETAEANIALGLDAARYNSGSVLRIGEANARMIETVYNQNAEFMGIEGVENIRRHFIEEQHTLGTIRAMQGASGAGVNTDTNRHYFLDQAYEAEWSRQYQGQKTKLSILNYMNEQQMRADITRLDASEKAGTIMYNAEIEAQIAMNEANMQAVQIETQGALSGSIGRINAAATLASGTLDAYKTYKTFS